MRVLVTGGSGFIGFHVIPLLLQAGHEVHVAGIDSAGHPEGVQFHEVNLLASDCRDLLETIRPTHLLHLAWHVPPGQFWTAHENIKWLHASVELLKAFAATGGTRWVGAGTCAEYDWSRSGVFRETDPLVPATLYGACKVAVNNISERLGEELGVEVASGRIFFPYGPRETAGRFMPTVIEALLAGKPVACTEGLQIRDYVFVEDVAAAFVRILESSIVGAVNIGSGVPVAIRNVGCQLGEITGRAGLIRWGGIPSRPGEPQEVVADVSRLKSLGWLPHHPLGEGLKRTVEWWKTRLEQAQQEPTQ